MVRESRLHPDDLIAPLFVKEGAESPVPIMSLPGQMQHTRETLRQEVRELKDLGVPAVVLFGLPEKKDPEGSEAWNPDGIVQVALKDLRDEVGDDRGVANRSGHEGAAVRLDELADLRGGRDERAEHGVDC